MKLIKKIYSVSMNDRQRLSSGFIGSADMKMNEASVANSNQREPGISGRIFGFLRVLFSHIQRLNSRNRFHLKNGAF
jgi:hypothetical protein